MPKALKVTEDNIEFIIEYGTLLQFNLRDVKDNREYYAEDGWNLYLITDGTVEHNNITFTEFPEVDFFRLWKFKTAEMPTQFVEIERV